MPMSGAYPVLPLQSSSTSSLAKSVIISQVSHVDISTRCYLHVVSPRLGTAWPRAVRKMPRSEVTQGAWEAAQVPVLACQLRKI